MEETKSASADAGGEKFCAFFHVAAVFPLLFGLTLTHRHLLRVIAASRSCIASRAISEHFEQVNVAARPHEEGKNFSRNLIGCTIFGKTSELRL